MITFHIRQADNHLVKIECLTHSGINSNISLTSSLFRELLEKNELEEWIRKKFLEKIERADEVLEEEKATLREILQGILTKAEVNIDNGVKKITI